MVKVNIVSIVWEYTCEYILEIFSKVCEAKSKAY